jgi:hypothetical protein
MGFDFDVISDLLEQSMNLDGLDIPEPEYEIQVYATDEDESCAGGACKI